MCRGGRLCWKRSTHLPWGTEEQPLSAQFPPALPGAGEGTVWRRGKGILLYPKGEAGLNFSRTSFLTLPLLPGLLPRRVWPWGPRKTHPPLKPLHQHLNHAAKSLLSHNMLWTLSAPRVASGSGQALREKPGVQAVIPPPPPR